MYCNLPSIQIHVNFLAFASLTFAALFIPSLFSLYLPALVLVSLFFSVSLYPNIVFPSNIPPCWSLLPYPSVILASLSPSCLLCSPIPPLAHIPHHSLVHMRFRYPPTSSLLPSIAISLLSFLCILILFTLCNLKTPSLPPPKLAFLNL